MSIDYNFLRVRVDLSALRHNHRLLSAMGTRTMPVVKADAYGHGLSQVAQALSAEGAGTFAVGTVEEAAALRASGHARRVISLLGPLEERDYPLLWQADILPFLHSFEQLEALARHGAGRAETLRVAVKFDTGMRRLGFAPEDAPQVAERLKAMENVRLEMVSSHLATADDPEHRYASVDALQAMLPACRLQSQVFTVTHADGADFLAALKAIGATVAAEGHRPLSPGALRRVIKAMGAPVEVSYHVVHATLMRSRS